MNFPLLGNSNQSFRPATKSHCTKAATVMPVTALEQHASTAPACRSLLPRTVAALPNANVVVSDSHYSYTV